MYLSKYEKIIEMHNNKVATVASLLPPDPYGISEENFASGPQAPKQSPKQLFAMTPKQTEAVDKLSPLPDRRTIKLQDAGPLLIGQPLHSEVLAVELARNPQLCHGKPT